MSENNRVPAPPAKGPVEKAEAPKEAKKEAKAEAPKEAKASGGIEVIADRPGFYEGRRRSVGQRFLIKDLSKLGSWMRLADSKAQAEREASERVKKAKRAGK